MSIKNNYQYNIIQSMANVVFPLITFPYAARVISPEGIGQVQFIFAFAQFFAFLAGFGIPIYGVKVISEYREDPLKLSKVTTELLILGSISSLAFTLGYCFSSQFLPQFISYKIEFIMSALLVLLSVLNVDWFFSGLEEFRFIAIRSILIKIIGVVMLFLLVKTAEDAFYYLVFMLFISLGNYLYNFIFLLKKVRLNFKELLLKRHLKPLFFIFIMALSTMLYTTLDTVILGLMSTPDEVGFYTAAVKITKVSLPILTGMGIVIVPKAVLYIRDKNEKQLNELYVKSFSFIALLSVPMSFGIYVLNEEIVYLFSGEAFSGAKESIKYLCFLPIMIGIGHFVAFQILLPLNKNKAMFYGTFLGMLFFIIMSFLFIPTFGSEGAAMANLFTEIIVTLVYLFFVPKPIIKSLPWKKLLHAVLCSLTFFPIIYFLKFKLFLNEVFLLPIGLVLCSSTYFVIQHIFFKEKLVREIGETISNKFK